MFFFTRKDDGHNIKEYIKETKSLWGKLWKFCVGMNLRGDATI
jgi:hypothetical protein